MAYRSLEASRAQYDAEGAYLLEHPEDLGVTSNGGNPASIWQWPEVRQLQVDTKAVTTALHQCDDKLFNAPGAMTAADYPKPTRLLSNLRGFARLRVQQWPFFDEHGTKV